MKDSLALLRLMLDSFAKIRDFTAGMSYEDFLTDKKTQSAVIMQLEVVGELAKRVSEEIRSDIDVPWKQMAGLRNLVAHNYFGLDLKIVWRTVSESAPEVESKVRVYVSSRDAT